MIFMTFHKNFWMFIHFSKCS